MQLSDENAFSIVISDEIVVMLLTREYFSTFISKSIADAKTQTEVLLALSADSHETVDALVAKAFAAGGTEPREPQDLGFMYGRPFEDLDGHTWEIFYMDLSAAPPQP